MCARQHRKSSTTATSTEHIRCRPVTDGEIPAVHRLIREVFTTQVAPLYTEEGVRSFLDYIEPDELAQRAGRDHELIAAEDAGTGDILGVAEVRRCTHISLLFVSAEVQRAGVGRRLLEHVCSRCRSRGRRILTVNAAPNAVSAYERLGFSVQGPEREEAGIRSVPMMRTVEESP